MIHGAACGMANYLKMASGAGIRREAGDRRKKARGGFDSPRFLETQGFVHERQHGRKVNTSTPRMNHRAEKIRP